MVEVGRFSTAGERLAEELGAMELARPCVVAAVSATGLAVAAPVARALRAPLGTVVTARLKLGAPHDTVFGALNEDDLAIFDYPTVTGLRASMAEIDEARERARAVIRRRLHGPRRPLGSLLPAATVVVVTDTMSTGLAVQSAIVLAHARGAEEVVAAAAYSTAMAAARVRGLADRLVVLEMGTERRTASDLFDDVPPDAAAVAELLGMVH